MKGVLTLKIIIITILFLVSKNGLSQTIDEYKEKLNTDIPDSTKYEYYTYIISYYYSVNLDSAKYFAQEKLTFAQDYNNAFRVGQSYNDLGLAYDYAGEYNKATQLYNLSLQKFKEDDYKLGIATALLNLGIVEYFKGDLEKSLEYYLLSLEINKELGQKKGTSSLYTNIGTIYQNLHKYEEAIKYYELGKAIDEELQDTIGLAGVLNNMGIAYKLDGKLEQALNCYEKSLELKYAINDVTGIASSLSNLSRLYFAERENEKALDYALRALDIELTHSSTLNILGSYINIGEIYLEKRNNSKASIYLNRGLELIKTVHSTEHKMELYGLLSLLEKRKNNYKKSLEYAEYYTTYKDSAYEEMSTQVVLELKSKYETEQKEKEIESLTRDNDLKELEVEREKIMVAKEKAERIAQQEASKRKSFLLWGTITLFLLAVGVALYSLKISKARKKDNLLLSEQKFQIEEKNKEITDSINYAQRIQQALLQTEKHASEKFPPHFILFQPKDIVSGDFYWAIEKQGYLYIAAADCTGHGVPGAFMSMLGIAFLNEINSKEKLLSPAEILDKLRERVIKELGQKGEEGESKDGMDISLLRLKLENQTVEWAGANNPLYIISKGELLEVKSNRQSIGYTDNPTPFTNHEFEVKKDDVLYVFSDGYADQFGGKRGKKMKYKLFKKILLSNSIKEMDAQKQVLQDEFEGWKGDLEQIDDVCVIGLKV